jgi:hypothetical protein
MLNTPWACQLGLLQMIVKSLSLSNISDADSLELSAVVSPPADSSVEF